jgi:hypothetical protein
MPKPDPMDVIGWRVELDSVKPRMLSSPLQPQTNLQTVFSNDHAGESSTCLKYNARLLRVHLCGAERAYERAKLTEQLPRHWIFPLEVIVDPIRAARMRHVARHKLMTALRDFQSGRFRLRGIVSSRHAHIINAAQKMRRSELRLMAFVLFLLKPRLPVSPEAQQPTHRA